jgi:hypothetical protein
MLKNEVSQRKKVILFTLLIILNIVLRIPSIPHEKGADSFTIHSYANSITSLGGAYWWVNWLSVFGLYPNSYASAIPFSLSGLSQLTGLASIEMEDTILLFSVGIGLLSVFTAYSLAGTVYNNFLFKYTMALFYSISQGILIFSTWEISTRGPFMILLPLCLFTLLKRIHSGKKALLMSMLGVFLAATHHFFYFLIPLTGLYIVMNVLFKIVPKWNKIERLNYIYIVSLIIVLTYPFLSHSMITAGSRYDWILDAGIMNTRFIGPTIALFLGGFTNLVFTKDKKFEEWYFLLAFLGLCLVFYNQTYGAYILLLFSIFFITVAFKNMIALNNKNRKIITIIIIIMIISLSTFSCFYNHFRTGKAKDYWYMSEEEYSLSTWGINYISEGQIAISQGLLSYRTLAASNGHPSLPKENISEIEVIKVNKNSTLYYFEGPYILKPGTSLSGRLTWLYELDNVDDSRAQRIIRDVNAKYSLKNNLYPTNLDYSIQNTRSKIFESGMFAYYLL